MSFRRIVLYFRREDIDEPELAALLDQANGMYSMGVRDSQMIHRILGELLREQEEEANFRRECQHSLLNLLLYLLVRQKRVAEPVKQSRKQEWGR